jgi:hypothetical protein
MHIYPVYIAYIPDGGEMTKILLAIEDEMKEALEDRINGIYLPKNTTVSRMIRMAILYMLMMNDEDLGDLVSWGSSAEGQYEGYNSLFDQYKKSGLIPETIPRGNGYYRELQTAMAYFFNRQISEEDFKERMQKLEFLVKNQKYSPFIHGYQPPRLFERLKETAQKIHDGEIPEDNEMDKLNPEVNKRIRESIMQRNTNKE